MWEIGPKAQSFTIKTHLWRNHPNISNGCRKPRERTLPHYNPAPGRATGRRGEGDSNMAQTPPRSRSSDGHIPGAGRCRCSLVGQPHCHLLLRDPSPAVTTSTSAGPFPLPGWVGSRMDPGGQSSRGQPPLAGSRRGEAGAGRAAGPKPPDGNTLLLTRCGFRVITPSGLPCFVRSWDGRPPRSLRPAPPWLRPGTVPPGDLSAPESLSQPTLIALYRGQPAAGPARGAATSHPLSGDRTGLFQAAPWARGG